MTSYHIISSRILLYLSLGRSKTYIVEMRLGIRSHPMFDDMQRVLRSSVRKYEKMSEGLHWVFWFWQNNRNSGDACEQDLMQYDCFKADNYLISLFNIIKAMNMETDRI
jgi:hypothetical protein